MTGPIPPPPGQLPIGQPAAGQASLGRSLQLDNGDLVFDPHAGDLAQVEQLEALSQALRLAIGTQLGTDRLNAGFGFDRLAVGAYAFDLATRKEYVKMQLVRCVGADARVRDVRDIFFSDDATAFDLQPQLDEQAQKRIIAAVRASREYTVYVVVDTITSQPLTVDAEGSLG
jgi:hypothetical protein